MHILIQNGLPRSWLAFVLLNLVLDGAWRLEFIQRLLSSLVRLHKVHRLDNIGNKKRTPVFQRGIPPKDLFLFAHFSWP